LYGYYTTNPKQLRMKRLNLLLIVIIPAVLAATSQPQRDWTIVDTYDINGKASGLAWDGSAYIYHGIYGTNGDKVYRFNTATGLSNLQFSNPAIDDCYGMTWDGQHLWIIDQPSGAANPALATELDLSGNILSTITLPDHYMSGIAWDNGDFWVCTYYPDPGTIYKIDNSGTILTQFQSPGEQPWDICLENGDLWVADYYDDMLYKIDISGSLLEAHPSENIKPSGIVFDGNYLWYCDGQISTTPSTLYKVDPGGAGTPAISIPLTMHDYGIVTIGNNPVWNMVVSSTGTAPLVIQSIDIPPGEPVSTSFTTPATVQPGNSVTVPLFYTPVNPVPMNVLVQVVSNDPVNPSVAVRLTGHGVNPGPSAQAGVTAHDFETVRSHAHTRWFFSVQNIGDEVLEITEINSSGPNFYVFPDETFPITVQTLDTAMIGMWFNPASAIQYDGTMEVMTNDPAQPEISVTLEGEGNDQLWPIGELLWHYLIDVSWDNSPKAIAAVNDITYDGVADVIVCSEDNFVRCFNGNSSGLADVMWEYDIGNGSVYNQNGLSVADINGDGLEEVVIGTTGGSRSIIALDGKTGSLIWQRHTYEYGEGGWVYQVDCSYDYNGDGIVDVLASTGDDGGGTGPRRIYCLDGLSGESIWECYTGGPNFSCLGVKDFTGDGQADVIAGASNSMETDGIVYGINGLDGEIAWSHTVDGSSVWALGQLNDINGDGIHEVAAGDGVIPGGHIYYLDAATGAPLHTASLGHIINAFVKIDDMDADGHPDFLIAYGGTNGIVISGYDASVIWMQPLADKAWVADGMDDISGDGMSDVIIGTLYSNNNCYFMNGLNGDELATIPFSTPVDAISAIPDITGDFSMEMVAGGRNGKLNCYSGGLNAATGISEPAVGGKRLQASCHPNPFMPATGQHLSIQYSLPESAAVSLEIFDVRGKMVYAEEVGNKQNGLHVAGWNGCGDKRQPLSAGLYFCRITAGNYTASLKIQVL
jgi:hypothetical protein